MKKLVTMLSGGRDTLAPTVIITSSESSPSWATTIPLTITFSENVTGFVVGDITVVGCTLSGFAGSGKDYTVTATPTANDITIDIGAGVCTDLAGNNNIAATQFVMVAAIVNLIRWFDMSDINTLFKDAGTTPVTADGDNIRQINDKSGNGGKFTGAATADPLYKINRQNGKPGALFDGTNDYWTTTATIADLGMNDGAWTLLCVFKPLVLDTNQATVYNNDCIWAITGGYGGVFMKSVPDIRIYNYDGSTDVTTAEAVVVGTALLSTAYQTGGNVSHAIGSGTPQSVASGNNTGSTQKIQVGFAGGSGAFTNLDFYEMVFWNVKISSAALAAIIPALKTKWGIT